MKTIIELKNEGLISARLYNSIIRGIYFDGKFRTTGKYRWDVNRPDGDQLTVKDIFELWTDEEILSWRGVGLGVLKELKSLI